MAQFIRFFICMLLCVSPIGSLLAHGWGKSDEVVHQYGEGNLTWNNVYYDMQGLSFTSLFPGYENTHLQNGGVVMFGSPVENTHYVILTTLNAAFKTPKTVKAFVKLIKEANSDYIVNPIECEEFGAQYAVDLVPKSKKVTAFWRFLVSNNRLVKMGTDDIHEENRLYFFQSIFIKPEPQPVATDDNNGT
jgi:hypothetical protein